VLAGELPVLELEAELEADVGSTPRTFKVACVASSFNV